MKKIVFLGSILIGGVAFASDNGEASKAVAEAETSDIVTEAEASNDVSGAEAFNGAYVGAGVAFGHIENKASVTWNSLGANCSDILNKKKDLFGASIALGYGRVFSNNLYLGGEFLVDILGNKSFSGTYDWDGDIPYSSKIRGVIPSIALKLGYYVDSINALVYLRGGVAYVKSDFYDGFVDAASSSFPINSDKYGQRHDMSQITPIIGMGIEKKFGSFGIRLEGDYRFNASKNFTEGVRVPGQPGMQAKIRNRVNGYTIRLMVTYNFR